MGDEPDPYAIQQTVEFMRGLLPRIIYFTLHGKATEALLEDVIVIQGQSFRIRPLIRFGGVVFDNPCAVGKAMHQHLCATHGYTNRPPRTFDGWNKLKVVIDSSIYRLEHLLPSNARKGIEGMTQLPPLGQDKRKHDLKAILDLPSHTESRTTVPSRTVVRASRKRRRIDELPPPPPPPITSLPEIAELVAHDPVALKERDLFPFMTILSAHFSTRDPKAILQNVLRMGHNAWESITGARAWWDWEV